jgi:hypothetical protein
MLRKFAVALLAATVFTAPALAQGASGGAKSPAVAATTSPNTKTKATTKTVAAKPTSAKLHKGYRHLAHVKHVKKHVNYATAAPSPANVKHHVRQVVKKPASTTGTAAAPKSGMN